MRTHKLTPDGFWLIRINLQKKCLKTILAIVVIVPIIGFWLLSFNFISTMVVILGFIILSLLNYFRSLRIQKTGLDSYELTVDEGMIVRKQDELPEVAIQRDQVTGIHETAGVGMLVMTGDCYKYIFIPVMLDNYDEVRDELKEWKAIEIMPDRKILSRPLPAAIVFSVSLMTTILAEDIGLFLPAGLLLVSLLVYTLFELHIDIDVSSRVKRKRLITKGLVLSVSILILRLLNWFNYT